jgi:KAP family P-loop domain
LGPRVPLENDPIVIDFSPWWFSGSEDLLRQFVEQISIQLRRDKKAMEKLSSLPDLLDTLDAALTPSVAIPHGAKGKIIVKMISSVARFLNRTKDVAAIRREIEKTLRSQTDRIVVFLDDLDRLEPRELLQVFQVVKAIADLPRLIYVLSFDRKAVTEGLAKANVHDPDQYIEKIVQSVWTLPIADRLGIAQLTGSIISELFDEVLAEMWQGERWQSLYPAGLRELIRTPRDVKRLANAIRPSYPPVKSEVNVIDFIGFHALRVLVPEAHRFIIANREWLTTSDVVFFRDEDDERKDYNRRIDTLVNSLDPYQQGPVVKILETMFPMFGRRQKRANISDNSYTLWRRECRICSPDRFDFYDRLNIPSGAISTAELNRILDPPSTDAFRSDLLKMAVEQAYDGSPKLKKFLAYASGNIAGGIPRDQRQRLLTHVFCVADELVSKLEPSSLPFQTFDWQFAQLVSCIVALLPKGTERVTAMILAWTGGSAISVMVRCFYLWKELLESAESGDLTTTTYFNREELEVLKPVLRDRVIVAAGNGMLAKTPLLDFVLFFWDEIAEGAGSQFAFELSSSEEGFADLVVGALSPRPSMVTNPVDRCDVTLMNRWAKKETDELQRRCENILAERPAWLSEIHLISLQALIDEVRNPRDAFGRPVRTNT